MQNKLIELTHSSYCNRMSNQIDASSAEASRNFHFRSYDESASISLSTGRGDKPQRSGHKWTRGSGEERRHLERRHALSGEVRSVNWNFSEWEERSLRGVLLCCELRLEQKQREEREFDFFFFVSVNTGDVLSSRWYRFGFYVRCCLCSLVCTVN